MAGESISGVRHPGSTEPERQTGEERGERDRGKQGREKSQLLAGSPRSSSSQGALNS